MDVANAFRRGRAVGAPDHSGAGRRRIRGPRLTAHRADYGAPATSRLRRQYPVRSTVRGRPSEFANPPDGWRGPPTLHRTHQRASGATQVWEPLATTLWILGIVARCPRVIRHDDPPSRRLPPADITIDDGAIVPAISGHSEGSDPARSDPSTERRS